jgi:tetratricopeptide (TPR) repeat protein
LTRAQAAAPRSALIQLNAANGFKRCGAFEPALAAFDRALALDPRLARAEHNRANLLLEMGRAEEALAGYLRSALLRRAPGATQEADASTFSHTTEAKLVHDLEQFAHLRLRGRPLAEHETVVAAHQAALAALRAAGPSGGAAFALPPDLRTALAPSYNRLLALDEGAKLKEGALDPAADYAGCMAAYEAGVGIAWLDGLLRPAALEALRIYCLGSTFWSTYRYANGYLGAFVENGFAAPLVGQIAEELARRLPRIFAGHKLRKVWAFKYADGAQGIGIHADLAAINVNFWITPDSANRDPAHGGLVVWDREAPLDWDFQAYNKDEARIRAFLAESKARAVRIPYRCNRAVIFNSDLFHETDRLDFAPGYANRRINITMLYGLRQERARRTDS